MSVDAEALRRGVHNLLAECAEARAGESILILREDPALGYFGPGLAEAISAEATRQGLHVHQLDVPFIPDVTALTPELAQQIARFDHAVFLARLGDQLRFQAMPANCKPITSYVLDAPSLASAFGSASYRGFVRLKELFNALFLRAEVISITCPLGTALSGRVRAPRDQAPLDVSIKRFPVSIFAPLDAAGFSGRVAVARLLAGTGSRYYHPYGRALGSPVFARIADGRLCDWEGEAAEIAGVRAHYAHVAALFGIDGDVVHSWHAGIHPGCTYAGSAHDHYERWSGSAFGNPRLLHFHTCGDYAPGEICWNIVDPTIEVDGVTLWRQGRIEIAHVPGAEEVLANHPDIAELFANPSPMMGLAP